MLKAGQCGSAVQLNAHLVHKRSGVAPYELGVVLEVLLRLLQQPIQPQLCGCCSVKQHPQPGP